MRVAAALGILLISISIQPMAQEATTASAAPGAGAGLSCSTTPQSGQNGVTAMVCESSTAAGVPASWFTFERCPLDMRVRQRAGGALLETDGQGRRVYSYVPRLKLELRDPRADENGQRMVSASVTVRGWIPKARAVPLHSASGDDGDLVRRMTVPLTAEGVPEASGDLELPGFAAARMVRLESVTLADGQVRNFHSCQAAPDLYMPVGVSK